jgi:RHS repeat-associated protein
MSAKPRRQAAASRSGQTVATTGSTTSPYKFAATSGYRNDGDAGLMHVGARYYDSQVGRFVTRDTVLTEHPYLYCEHDPINAVDPGGHDEYKWYNWCELGGGATPGCGYIVSFVRPPAGLALEVIGTGIGVIGAIGDIYDHLPRHPPKGRPQPTPPVSPGWTPYRGTSPASRIIYN